MESIDECRNNDIPDIFVQEIHQPDLVDFDREPDGNEDIHCIETNPGTDIAVKETGFLPTDYLIKNEITLHS